jgi:ADP-heptose:LPS heptosyltransferase
MDNKVISVKRVHGLGNLIFLLPVLDYYCSKGYTIELFTNIEWRDFITAVRPNYVLLKKNLENTIDLDDATKNISPQTHKTNEFCELLGVNSNLLANKFFLSVPNEVIKENFKKMGCYIVVAPTAGHKARQWPEKYIKDICKEQHHKKIILVGKEKYGAFPCYLDLRDKLSVLELSSIIYNAELIISMDSGVLHLANALQKPTIAIFSGINPIYRVLEYHKCLVLQADLDCCPCNKNEICDGNYNCLQKIKPFHIVEAFDKIRGIQRRTIWKI